MLDLKTNIEEISGEIGAVILDEPGEINSQILGYDGETSATIEEDKTAVMAECGCDSRTTALLASDGVLYDDNSQPIFVTE